MTQTILSGFQIISIGAVFPSKMNTRRRMDEKALKELAESVRTHGILTPLLVRSDGNGKYEIAAGERRYRAARLAELDTVPAIVREMDDAHFLEVVTVENLQREDVHPLDEGLGYARLMKEAGYTAEQVAAKVGKSESYVYQRLKLAELVPAVQKVFLEDKITASHAILIARLLPKDQERVLASALFARAWVSHGGKSAALRSPGQSGEVTRTVSVRELELWIHGHLLLNLQKAPWKKDDAGLFPEAGPCTTCPKRAANQPALFPDVGKGDVCTDGHCFGRKFSLYIGQRLKETSEKTGKPALKLTREYGRGGGKDVISLNGWSSEKKEVKKESCKSAQPGVIVTGRDAGQVAWVCLDKGCKVHRSPAQRETPEYLAKQKERHKKTQLEELVRFRMEESWLNPHDYKRLLELAGLVGVDPKKIEAEEKARAKERERLGLKTGICRVCGCTMTKPCKPPCSWTDPTETLCDSPKCVKAARWKELEKAAEIGSPPAAKVQTTAKGKKGK